MLRRSFVRGCLVAASLVLGGPALAQDTTGLSSELERTANITPEEKVQYADQARAEIGEAVKVISRFLDAAKKNGDVEGIQCLTSRLTAVRALQVVVDNAAVSMSASLSAGEGEKADHELRKIAVAITKTRMLLAEAQRCGAEQAVASGDTLISVNEDELIVPGVEDPGALDDVDVLPDLPQVSPFAPPPS